VDYKIIWTDEALLDVEDIAEYIQRNSVFYASSVVTQIIDTTKKLSFFPFSSRIVPEEGNEFVRESFVYSYRIIFEIIDDSVYILAVIHGNRLLSPILAKRKNKS